jgi:hypothetical protein
MTWSTEIIAALIGLVSAILGGIVPVILHHYLSKKRANEFPAITTPPPIKDSLAANISFMSALFGLVSFGLTSIPAIIAGQMALKNIQLSEGYLRGKKRAWIGLILGYIELFFIIVAYNLYKLISWIFN